MLEKGLKDFLNDYLLKIEDNASTPFYEDHFISPYICTEYKDLKKKIEIYYYPYSGKYTILLIDNKRTILNADIRVIEVNNNAELLLLEMYKLIYVSKQEEVKEEVKTEEEIKEIAES